MLANTLATALVCGAREAGSTGLGIADHLRRVRIGFTPPSLGEQSRCSIAGAPTAAMRWAGARQLPHPVSKD